VTIDYGSEDAAVMKNGKVNSVRRGS
jgi:hypothetical protein